MNGKTAVFITGMIVLMGLMMFYQSRNSAPAVDYWERVQVIRDAGEAIAEIAAQDDPESVLATEPPVQSQWFSRSSIDPLDDSVSLIMRRWSDSDDGEGFTSPFTGKLVVKCQHDTTAVYIVWNEFIGYGQAEVAVRTTGAASRESWETRRTLDVDIGGFGGYEGQDDQVTIAPLPIRLLREVAEADRVVVRVTPSGGTPRTLIFDLDAKDTREAIVQVATACHWTLDPEADPVVAVEKVEVEEEAVPDETASTMPRQVGMEFYESQGWVIVRAIGEPSKHYAAVVSAAWEHEMEQARRDPRVTLFVVFYPPDAEADDWSDGTTIHTTSIGSYIRPYGADTFMTEAELEEWQNQPVEDLLPSSARQPEEGSTARTGYVRFQQKLGAGADCQELFEIRNEVRRADQSSAGRMNEDLRAIGCYSSTSSRTS